MASHFSPLEANVHRIYRHDRQHSFGTKKRYRESCEVKGASIVKYPVEHS